MSVVFVLISHLGFCGHDLTFNQLDMDSDLQCTSESLRPVTLLLPIYPEARGLAFIPPFLECHGAFVCDQDLAPTVRIRDLNRRFQISGLQVSPGLRFQVACCLTIPRRQLRGVM